MHEEDVKRVYGSSGEAFRVSYKMNGIPGFRGTGNIAVLGSMTFGELAQKLDEDVGKGKWCDVRVRRL